MNCSVCRLSVDAGCKSGALWGENYPIRNDPKPAKILGSAKADGWVKPDRSDCKP